ncbi:MAG: GIY-YIG nuclease family protein [Puniceicoccaceae bacterium]
MAELSDKELLDALGVEAEQEKKVTHTPREERIIAGFEEIQKFVEENGRLPQHGEENDIFERLYAVRLDQIRKLKECKDLVSEMDYQGLLCGSFEPVDSVPDDIPDEELLEQLGVSPANEDGSITTLRHVKPRAEIRAAEEIAQRTPCRDFDTFKPVFQAVQEDLNEGVRRTIPYKDNAKVNKGDFFILGGQKLIVAELGEEFVNNYDKIDRRLRVIYDNGTESDILLRSLQRGLNKDETSRRITDPSLGPLFSSTQSDDDVASGTIYVLRSKSDLPIVEENRDVLHKIGVTGGGVKQRFANARHDATFLLADVEVVATFELFNINRAKLENLIHRFFAPARLDITINDRFGDPVRPREWFLVPLFIINEVVDKIVDGTIADYSYDPKSVKLIPLEK